MPSADMLTLSMISMLPPASGDFHVGADGKSARGGGIFARAGGYSHLTEEAKRLMRCYTAFMEEADEMLQKVFQKHFSELGRF